jgi:hypothetical protein
MSDQNVCAECRYHNSQCKRPNLNGEPPGLDSSGKYNGPYGADPACEHFGYNKTWRHVLALERIVPLLEELVRMNRKNPPCRD